MPNSQRLFSSLILCIIFYPHFLHGQMTAIIKYEYYSSSSNYLNITEDSQTNGIVSSKGSQSTVRNGQAFILMDSNGNYNACQQPINTMNYSNGVAIIQRGGDCTFSVKITRAKQYGASAVIIYDPQNNGLDVFDMLQNNSDILSLYVQRSIGSLLFNLANNNQTHLNITIEPVNIDYDTPYRGGLWYSSRGAVIFIIVSICILICLCISWFIFYYCQRFRLRTSKDRLQNRLINAAKKALTKIPLVTITENSHHEESCVICLDAIKVGDTVRQLICGHTFHQHCVDPWLINHRHCPLCNLDILAAYRISIPGINHHRSNIPENLIPNSYTSLATTAVIPIVQNEQQTLQIQPIVSISESIKDDKHGEQNPSFRSDDDQQH